MPLLFSLNVRPSGQHARTRVIALVALGRERTKQRAPRRTQQATKEELVSRALEDAWRFVFGELGTGKEQVEGMAKAKAQRCGPNREVQMLGRCACLRLHTWLGEAPDSWESWTDLRRWRTLKQGESRIGTGCISGWRLDWESGQGFP